MPKRIMFVCTGNSVRSQIAEGLARELGRGKLEVRSAGLEPKGVNPMSLRAMNEIGIDISSQTSKLIEPDLMKTMDMVITLCGDARDRCPILPPGIAHVHWPIVDPAVVEGSDEEIARAFRSVRDELKERIERLLQGDKSMLFGDKAQVSPVRQ